MAMDIDSLRSNLSNPARTYMWEVLIPQIPGGDGANSEDLELRGFSAAIPGRSVGVIKIPFKGTAGMKVPGKVTMSQTWTVQFREAMDAKVFDALHGWQQFILNAKTGVGNLDALVKTTLYLNMLNLEGATWMTIKLLGAYIENMADVPLSYADEGVVVFSCTFSYDRWEKV